ncbi:MAG: hypothetical protein WDA00_03175 [Eubacteriales bacterium]
MKNQQPNCTVTMICLSALVLGIVLGGLLPFGRTAKPAYAVPQSRDIGRMEIKADTRDGFLTHMLPALTVAKLRHAVKDARKPVRRLHDIFTRTVERSVAEQSGIPATTAEVTTVTEQTHAPATTTDRAGQISRKKKKIVYLEKQLPKSPHRGAPGSMSPGRSTTG